MTSRLAIVALWFLSGCASTSTIGLARTLNKRAAQGWVAPSGAGVIVTTAASGTPGTGYPFIEGGGRIGITDHFELGGRIGFNGIGVEGKVALLRPPTMETGVNISLNPMVNFVGFGGGNLFIGSLSFHLPVLIGIDFNGHELVLGPRVTDQLIFGGLISNGAAFNVLSAGGSIGFAVKVSPVFRIIPEVSIGVPFLTTAGTVSPGASATALGVGGVTFQAGLGFMFGGPDQYDTVEPKPLTAPPPPPPLVPAPAPPPPNAL